MQAQQKADVAGHHDDEVVSDTPSAAGTPLRDSTATAAPCGAFTSYLEGALLSEVPALM